MSVVTPIRAGLPIPAPLSPRMGWRAPADVYTFGEICRQLGVHAHATGWQIGYLRALVARSGFPMPHPHYCHRQRLLTEGAEAIRPRARWDRIAVDAWFDGQLPPGAREAASSAARSRDADALDANAAGLTLGRKRA